MGHMPLAKRSNHAYNHTFHYDKPTDAHIKFLVEKVGYTEERAQSLNKSQAQAVIANHMDVARRNGTGEKPKPRTQLVKTTNYRLPSGFRARPIDND